MHRHTSHCTRGLTPERRLLHYLPDRPADQCWLWTGTISSKGYGVLGTRDKDRKYTQIKAHRLAHEIWIGPIPDGFTVDHVRARGCTSTLCCNPAHLEAVTDRENIIRGDGAYRRNSRKTECVHGHPFDIPRVVNGKTYRDCSTCRKERGKRHDEKRRADPGTYGRILEYQTAYRAAKRFASQASL